MLVSPWPTPSTITTHDRDSVAWLLVGEPMNDRQIFAKCAWRLIPFMMGLFVVNFLDRVNVGFAALTMNKDLGFSPTVFGIGGGIVFVGYSLFQMPANAILHRMGAKRWMFCIMAVWGTISAGCAFVQTPTSFYILRFLLGVAEAGLFPGFVFYLTLWFPEEYRARFTATFSAAVPISFVVGGPISGAILGFEGFAGLHGWQWLFLLEGLPAVFLAFVVLAYLPDGPREVRWLTPEQKATISASLSAETNIGQRDPFWQVLRDTRLLTLGAVSFAFVTGMIGLQIWLPQIVQAMGFSNLATGVIVGLIFAIAVPAMILWGRHSDRNGERIWHIALPAMLAALGFAVSSLTQSHLLSLVAFACATLGIFSYYGPFFSLPSSFLRGTSLASGIGLVNSIATMGGFAGPIVIGIIREATGNYAAAMAMLAAVFVLAATTVLALGGAMVARKVRVA